MKRRLVRMSVAQNARMVAVLYAFMGLLYTFLGLIMYRTEGGYSYMTVIYLVMPLLMLLFGYLFTAIFAGIYNLVARWLGGFEYEVHDMIPDAAAEPIHQENC